MSIRAKFRVSTVTDHYVHGNPKNECHKTVLLHAVTRDDGDPEDFWKYTPAGTLDITISYPDTAEQFVPGKSFYIDFTEADG